MRSPDPSEKLKSDDGAAAESGSGVVALSRSAGFWLIMRYALVFGVVLAFVALAFLALVKGGTDLWFALPKDPGWFDGSLWWVAVTAGAGVLVGVLRRVFRLPPKLPGTVEELKDQRVEPSTVLKAVAVSLVSLAGGASLGPEDALGKMGGGLGTWVSERRKLDEHVRATNTLSAMSGAYGGLLSSPILATVLVVELARPKGRRASATRWSRLCFPPRSRSACTFRSRGRHSLGSTRCRLTSTRTGSCSRPFRSAWSLGRWR